jgi:DNA-binding transcriptional ArsR family regulator
MREKILAALKKLGPSSPAAIAKETGEKASAIGHHLRAMQSDKTLKAAGLRRGRRYGLPDQDLAWPVSKPPSNARPRGKRRKAAKPHTPRPAPLQRAAQRFIPVVDVDMRLCIINGGEPLIFDEAQTLKIAKLLFVHYED